MVGNMALSEFINGLKMRIVNRFMYSARGDFDLRVRGTIVENVLWFLPEIRIALAILLQLYAASIAYDRSGPISAIFTGLLPILSQFYWAAFIYAESFGESLFFVFVNAIGWSMIWLLGKIEYVGFSFAFKFAHLLEWLKRGG